MRVVSNLFDLFLQHYGKCISIFIFVNSWDEDSRHLILKILVNQKKVKPLEDNSPSRDFSVYPWAIYSTIDYITCVRNIFIYFFRTCCMYKFVIVRIKKINKYKIIIFHCPYQYSAVTVPYPLEVKTAFITPICIETLLVAQFCSQI